MKDEIDMEHKIVRRWDKKLFVQQVFPHLFDIRTSQPQPNNTRNNIQCLLMLNRVRENN